MSSRVFAEGMPHGLITPMYDDGYAIEPGFIDPDFATALFGELKTNDMYSVGGAEVGRGPGVYHNDSIVESLGWMPRLAEYRNTLNDAITEVTGFDFPHLTYLTVRACPVGEMSSQIHRNDDAAGPWLVALTVAGSGSFNIYPNDVIGHGEERELTGDPSDPVPLASSDMGAGDAWGIYSKEWSAPHAGGLNTSSDPKVLVLLYGWHVRNRYPARDPDNVPPRPLGPPHKK
jgi:hypothetical protein